jgi:hypothetical protein
MACEITDLAVDVAADGSSVPVVGETVTAAPTLLPLFSSESGTFREVTDPTRTTTTSNTGSWSFTLPWPSESDPDTVEWSITTPDGFTWSGAVPEAVDGPLTLHTLKATYGWALASNQTRIPIAIQGPAGESGALTGTALPSAGVSYRGKTFTVTGTTGNPDAAYICLKLTDNSYGWFEIGAAP